jgi:hypothetical protein
MQKDKGRKTGSDWNRTMHHDRSSGSANRKGSRSSSTDRK